MTRRGSRRVTRKKSRRVSRRGSRRRTIRRTRKKSRKTKQKGGVLEEILIETIEYKKKNGSASFWNFLINIQNSGEESVTQYNTGTNAIQIYLMLENDPEKPKIMGFNIRSNNSININLESLYYFNLNNETVINYQYKPKSKKSTGVKFQVTFFNSIINKKSDVGDSTETVVIPKFIVELSQDALDIIEEKNREHSIGIHIKKNIVPWPTSKKIMKSKGELPSPK
jgi:hypothetical protein